VCDFTLLAGVWPGELL